MRKLRLWDVMTLDGYFEGPAKWDLGFHEMVWGEEMDGYSREHEQTTDTLLFGRVTYEGMASYWEKETGPVGDFMNRVEKVVVTRSDLQPAWNNSRRLEGDLVEAVTALKQAPGKDIYVFGSADLTHDLLEHGLVDEVRICLAPVVLGDGKPLFKPSGRQLQMTLLEAKPLKTGGVILRYAPKA